MESSHSLFYNSSTYFPTLLSTSKAKPKSRLRLELNLSPKSISSVATPRSKPSESVGTPKPKSFTKESLKSSGSILATKSPLRVFSIKPLMCSNILKFPATSEDLIRVFPETPDWVLEELQDYERIYYYCGSNKPQTRDEGDDKGDYNIKIGDDLLYRYEILEVLGKGSFGQVVKVYDHRDRKKLALKIIKNRQKYTDQANIEIELLMFLKSIDNDNKNHIVRLDDHFTFRGHTMITFELLGLNLYELLKRNGFRGLSITLIKRFSAQILKSLTVLSENSIIHSDLKPENILLSDSNLASVKLIDFGSSCYSNQRIYTYIQSRFYRAPEVVLGIPYTNAIDIWSFGCILAELYTGRPIFPCTSETELLTKIIEVLGEPPIEMLQGSRTKVFFKDGAFKYIGNERQKEPGSRKIRNILKGADQELISIVEGCLVWEPSKRVAVEITARSTWLVDSGEACSSAPTRRCRINMEDITKHTPQLQKFIAHRASTIKHQKDT